MDSNSPSTNLLTQCPLCHGPLHVQPGAKGVREKAENYADCHQACAACAIGLTNARPNPTFIRKDWRAGLWRTETASRLEHIVEHSLNRRSRAKKAIRLAYERSEDMLTWNVFSYLEDAGLLAEILKTVGVDTPPRDVQIYYWGANDRYSFPGIPLNQLFVETFCEKPSSVSEPDVMLLGTRQLTIIEAKLGSTNPVQKEKPFAKYVRPVSRWFRELPTVQTGGYYELTRNWAIGALIAERLGISFALVNLVREGEELGIETAFGRAISSLGNFRRLTWEKIADAADPILRGYLARQTLYGNLAFARR